jgi:DNA polymerase-3 subunit epsilon
MPYLVMDLEMTGNDPGWHEIIQIGAVLFDDDWREKGTYLQNVYPENEDAFSRPAEEVHGLSMADLEDAPLIFDVLPEFEDWIRRTLGRRKSHGAEFGMSKDLIDVIICGQSVVNDINFLRFAYNDDNRPWPFSYKMIDLHTTAYLIFRMMKRAGQETPRKLSLGAIAANFGLERETETHNALEDAQLTGKCFLAFFRLMDRFNFQAE